MDKNTIIGLVLIFLLLMVWQQFSGPSAEQMEAQKRHQDSLALVQQHQADSIAALENKAPQQDNISQNVETVPENDSVRMDKMAFTFGPFSSAATGEEKKVYLENELYKITFSNKGGMISQVELKNYFKETMLEKGKREKSNLLLLEDEKNKFEYMLPMPSLPSGGVNTGDLYFDIRQPDKNTIIFQAKTSMGGYFEQKYSIKEDSYNIDYDIRLEGLNNIIANNAEEIELKWLDYIDKIEINTTFERRYATTYYKPLNDGVDYCSLAKDDTEDVDNLPMKWVSHSNQFFNATIVAEESFNSALMDVVVLEEEADDLKKLQSTFKIPYGHNSSESFAMEFFVGPNEFDRLHTLGNDLDNIIPFGWSIFGTINRWVIRPIFNFLSQFIGSKGIVILLLTFIVKAVLYPLTYKMLHSQSKMGALKPEIEKVKERLKDDSQQQQVETMKLYREFGVNPLGGCMPMVVQMPIWFALYRFFPASIEFRQASFLWAPDLSSYDDLIRLGVDIPFMGSHLSLFTLLWAITTLIYTYYNSKHMDMSANPAMKYMQYLMPIMFLGFFNTYASGLTCYLFFSNVFNIGQTVVTKNWIIDQDKLKKEMDIFRKKPKKKKGGFGQKLETALKEQQKIQEERKKKGRR